MIHLNQNAMQVAQKKIVLQYSMNFQAVSVENTLYWFQFLEGISIFPTETLFLNPGSLYFRQLLCHKCDACNLYTLADLNISEIFKLRRQI